MVSCCGPKRVSMPRRLDLACPRCSGRGRAVNSVTVTALVNSKVRGEVGDDDYNICLDPACDVVYYNTGARFFEKSELTIRVAFKELGRPEDRVLLP